MKKERKGEEEKGRKGNHARRISLVFLSLCLFLSVSSLLSFSSFPFLSFSTATAHKYHFSFTQVEYNAKEKSAEITMRVFADDLENAISKHSGNAIKLDHKEAPSLIAEYVRTRFEIKGREGRAKKLTWIGLETKVDVILLYLEAKMPEGLNGAQLRQRLFFDLFEDQVNQVLCKTDASKTSLEFKSGDGFKLLALPSK